MIFLITGSLGAGKTSNTLWDLVHNPKYKNRPKFASYIPEFQYEKCGFEQIDKNDLENWVSWTDPKDDFSTVCNFPKGSIILIDEADLFIPATITDKNPPRWLREMARSRHHGLDFYIITQQSKMVSPFLHGLIQSHIHYHRPDGSELVTRYKWEHHQSNVYARSNRVLGLPKKVLVNPQVFTLYKSTAENTRIKTPPVHIYKKLALALLPMLIAPFFVYWYMLGRHLPDQPTEKPKQQQATQQTTKQTTPQTTQAPTAPQPIEQKSSSNLLDTNLGGLSVKDFIPPDPVLPWTAPAYADLAKPTDFPRIAACMDSIKTGCKCFTQQYTPIEVPEKSCKRMVKEGWFDNWATGRAQQNQVLSGQSGESSARQQLANNNRSSNLNNEGDIVR